MSDRELLAAIGKRITVARENAGMTPQALAAGAFVSVPTLYKWQRGDHDAGSVQLTRLAELTGVSAGWLLTGEGA